MQLIYLFIFTRLWKVLFNWYERFGGFKNENKLDLKKIVLQSMFRLFCSSQDRVSRRRPE